MKTNTKTLILCGCLLATFSPIAQAAGPLTPPGAPGDAPAQMPSLVEIKAAIDALAGGGLNGRTAIPAQAATYTISAPGNYVLTGNITVDSGDGINITASDVTVDLNGFTIKSTVAVPAGAGIRVSTTSSNIRIHNGRITSGFTYNMAPPREAPGPGFTFGIQLDIVPSQRSDNFVFEDLMITGINGYAIAQTDIASPALWRNAVARRVSVNGRDGIAFVYYVSSLRGKIIDCQIRAFSTNPCARATIIGQTHSENLGTGGLNVGDVTFNNN